MLVAAIAQSPGTAPGARAAGVEGGGAVGREGIDHLRALQARLVVEGQGVQPRPHDLGRQLQLTGLALDGLAAAGDLAPLAQGPHSGRRGALGHEALVFDVVGGVPVGGVPAPEPRLGIEGQDVVGMRGGRPCGRERRGMGHEGEGEADQAGQESEGRAPGGGARACESGHHRTPQLQQGQSPPPAWRVELGQAPARGQSRRAQVR